MIYLLKIFAFNKLLLEVCLSVYKSIYLIIGRTKNTENEVVSNSQKIAVSILI